MDKSAAPDDQLLHGEITRKILACAMEVSNGLGSGYLEAIYDRALALLLGEAGLKVELQKPLCVVFQSHTLGTYYADMVVEDCVLIELKAVRAWVPDHEAQLIHYLKGTGLEVGLLLNFGKPRLEYRRFTRSAELDDSA